MCNCLPDVSLVEAELYSQYQLLYLKFAVPHLRYDLLDDSTLSIYSNEAQVVGGDRGHDDAALGAQQG